ncbi:MAG: hypothetical protein AB9869_16460 [Verrucomicrobiia bacterium]
MSRSSAVTVGALAVLLVVLLGQSWRSKTALEARLRAMEAERAQWTEESRAANERLRRLTEERNGDRALLAQLWGMVHAGSPGPDGKRSEKAAARYDLTALKKMAGASGGDLNQVVRQVVTPEALNTSLQQHADQPACWVAAASLCGDRAQALQYLEAAASRFPGSALAQAALIEAKRDQRPVDASTWTAIQDLRNADPTGSLADHYEAYFRFQEGDTAGALQALAAASEKDRFADHRMELMMSRYQCLLENGCSDGGALALSAFSLGFEHLPMLREVSQKALEQAQAAYAAGDRERALTTADYVARIGRNLSASGRFIVYDRVGMEFQETALRAKRQFYGAADDALPVEEIDCQLGALQQRSAQIRDMTGAFGGILANLTDEGIVRYLEATIMHGEFTTLQDLTAKP